MAIENRNLEAGTRLVATYKKQAYVCSVEKAEEGEGLAYVLADGSRFKSPSSAAMKVMGGKAVNGWRFWSLDGEVATKPEPTASKAAAKTGKDKSVPSTSPRSQARKPAYKVIHVAKSQDNLQVGEVRWTCDACIRSWVLPAGEEPTKCPNGHKVDDPELNQGAAATEVESQ